MPQTFYIESDEEIISAIGRLRHSQETENFFVFPKRALILQSIINLRLFQKEAQKMNKTIVVVTQDEIGRMLAEKAGIRTENYSDDFSQKANHLELDKQDSPTEVAEKIEDVETKKDFATLKAAAIGSTSFYTSEPEAEIPLPKAPLTPVAEPTPKVQQLRIRNSSPYRPPSLNSMRQPGEDVGLEQQKPVVTVTPKPPLPKPIPRMEAIHPAKKPIPTPEAAPAALVQPKPATVHRPPLARPLPQAEKPRAPELPYEDKSAIVKSFFAPKQSTNQESVAKQSAPVAVPKKPAPDKKPSPALRKSAYGLFYFFGLLSVLIVVGVFAYLFFPKVSVKMTPMKAEEKVDLQVKGVPGASDAIDSTPVRLLEREIPVTVTGTATDSGSSTTEKAKGTLVVYNDYSTEPQSLVATTRFEAANGKVFRLVKGATIPGRTTSPGAIEVDVVADQAGPDSNIEPTSFTIPGFKGSDKYDKFTAKSLKPMTGGGSGGSEIKAISRADLDKAEADTKTQAEATFMKDIEGSLVPGEVFLKESLQLTPLETGNRPKEGVKGETFEYTRTYKMKAFLLQENLLKEKIKLGASRELDGVRMDVSKIDIDYGEVAPNFDDNTVSIKLHADIHKIASLDLETLKQKLLGKNTVDMEAFLAENPGVQKIELDFKPKWFGTSIPKQESRVELLLEE
jgi:hypothetical protein